jgi:ankyrin repeat protein
VAVLLCVGALGADINAPGPDGTTALHWAVRADDSQSAERLIRAGADVKAVDRYGITPLFLACTNANSAMVTKLLDSGADPNSADPAGVTALMMAARTEGGAGVVKVLLDRGAKVNAKDNDLHETALMWAVRENQPEAIQLLLKRGAEVNARTRVGAVPPRRAPNAAGFSHGVGIVRGGWPERGMQDPTPGGMTALLYAARDGRLDIAQMLVAAGADVNQAEANKMGPLLMAVTNYHLEAAKFLRDHGAAVNAADFWGRQPLWAAVELRNLEIDSSGNNGIDRAALLELIKTLLDHGADVNARTAEAPPIRSWVMPFGSDHSWVDFTGQTPFLRAALAGDITVMRLLLERGADPNIPTFANTTALMAASGVNWFVEQTYTESKESLLEAVKLCLEKGADVNTANSMGVTAVIGAANRGSDEILELLVQKGVRLDVKDNEG